MTVRTRRSGDRRVAAVAALAAAVGVWLALATVLPFPAGQSVVIGLSVLVPVGTGLLCAAWASEDTVGPRAGAHASPSRSTIRDHDHQQED